MQANVIVHPEPLVLHDFTLASRMMNMEQFPAAARGRGVLARDGAEKWQRELKAADAEGRFAVKWIVFGVGGGIVGNFNLVLQIMQKL